MSALARRDPERELADDIGSFTHDPLGFVLYAFPWGASGTDLEKHGGPRDWQRRVLQDIGEALRAGKDTQEAIRIAVASGHGVGKSALIAWIDLWALATCPDARVVLTANTEPQFRTKTWPEISKWFRLLICNHWFKLTLTSIFSAWPSHEKTWRCDYIAWSKNNVEAFAGLHNQGRRVVVLFDEASAIDDSVWEVSEGALTDEGTELIWIVFGNPTRNTGRFRECFGKYRHRWNHTQVDSRTVPGTNKAEIDGWVKDYGEDSDFVRVRVKGEFPRAGSHQFISGAVVDDARKRQATFNPTDPLIIGVDVARHGDDRTVIFFRRGRDARTIPPIKLRIPDLMQVAARVAEAAREHGADGIFVDMGMGAGVVDRLRQLNVKGVHGIEFGSAADGTRIGDARGSYANKRAEMWGNLKGWLPYGAIPDDNELADDLIGPEYGFNVRDEIQLERKEDMKKRGLASPDMGDALALTFALTVHKGGQSSPRKPRPGGGWMGA